MKTPLLMFLCSYLDCMSRLIEFENAIEERSLKIRSNIWTLWDFILFFVSALQTSREMFDKFWSSSLVLYLLIAFFSSWLLDETPIQQFYNKKSIFMTGATGFLGKSKFSSKFPLIWQQLRMNVTKNTKNRSNNLFGTHKAKFSRLVIWP